MSVGLYDIDFMKYGPIPFNLEIMKLSRYYKQKREIVGMPTYYCPEKYSKFIVRKDFYDGTFPTIHNNIDYGGLAFTNNVYKPLDEKIELCKPDTYIYNRLLESNMMGMSSDQLAKYKAMLESNHIRLSLDGETIWNKWDKNLNIGKSIQTIMFHDFDLNCICGGAELMTDLANQYPLLYFGMKFPIQIFNGKDLLKWQNIRGRYFFSMRYNGIIDNEILVEYAANCNQHNSKVLEYNVTYGCSEENEFFSKVLPKIYRQIVFLRNREIKFLLIYDNSIFKNKKWLHFMRILQLYASAPIIGTDYQKSLKKNKDSLYNFYLSMYKNKQYEKVIYTKDQFTDILEDFKKINPELYNDFRCCLKPYLKGGELVYDDTRRN